MVEYEFDTIEYHNLLKNIMSWGEQTGYVLKPKVQCWMNENMNGAVYYGQHHQYGTASFTRLVFKFNNEEDAMAFKLTWS